MLWRLFHPNCVQFLGVSAESEWLGSAGQGRAFQGGAGGPCVGCATRVVGSEGSSPQSPDRGAPSGMPPMSLHFVLRLLRMCMPFFPLHPTPPHAFRSANDPTSLNSISILQTTRAFC